MAGVMIMAGALGVLLWLSHHIKWVCGDCGVRWSLGDVHECEGVE